MDPAQSHGLGDCFLNALLDCVKTTEDLIPCLRVAPKREVSTHNNNRIDLVLAGDGWDLLLHLENITMGHFDEQEILGLIVEKMKLLMIFENERHPQLDQHTGEA